MPTESPDRAVVPRRSPWPHVLVWLSMLLLLLLWSLLAWAAHALAGWSGWSAWATGGGAGTAGWQVWIGALELPAWLAPWLPAQSLEAVKAMLAASAPMIEWAVASAPALMAWLPTLVLVFWGGGAVLLVLAGVALSVAVSVWRRRVQPALAGTR